MNAAQQGQDALWTAPEAAAALGLLSKASWQAGGVSIDSRTVAPGDLFVAIRGPRADGHDYVKPAFDHGAVAAVVEHEIADCAAERLLIVTDTLAALEALARAARTRSRAKIVAVTGSVGKTGTKEALKLVLSRQAKTSASLASLNNLWGVPLSLARMPRDAAYGVFELGMNHPGELDPLSRLVRPDVAIITTIATAHSEFFDSLIDIADAKAEIFRGMKGGVAVLNRDNAFFPVLAMAARSAGVERIIGFGAHKEAEARLLSYRPSMSGSEVSAEILGRTLDYTIGAAGRHWAINSLAVLAAVSALGADVAEAAAALAALSAPKGRGALHRVALQSGSFEVIDDSYNASPASMRAAIEILSASEPASGGRRIAILGDMLELGSGSPRLHAALAEPLHAGRIDLVFAAGPLMGQLYDALPAEMRGAKAADVDTLAPIVSAALKPGDVVLVKGSHGSRMDKMLERLLALGQTPRAVNG
jgi:UDP-N-acetylmuramoyl-tripeptide--D-alanyl-D-alanine ligase